MPLMQGIIRPFKSPYASQVVIKQNKSGEICLCVNYEKLNCLMVCGIFPLLWIDEALQAIHSHMYFSSFNLAQGYLPTCNGGR